MQTTVTVEYINPPRPGKKMGNIKTKELGAVFVWPDKLPLFQKGGTYAIEYEADGDFKKFVSLAAQQPTPAQAQQHSAASGHLSEDEKSEAIFVTGVIGRCFQGTGKMPPGDVLASMVESCRKAWRAGAPVQQQGDPGPQSPDDYYQ